MVKERLVWNGNISASVNMTMEEAKEQLGSVGATQRGVDIMVEKMIFWNIKITDVDTRAANILKQTMLSKGADAAVSAGTVNLSSNLTDVAVFATLKQLKEALERLKEQPWGLKDIVAAIEKIIF